MESREQAGLPVVGDDISPYLRRVVSALAEAKRVIDLHGRGPGSTSQFLAGAFPTKMTTSPVVGWSIARVILPFLGERDPGASFGAMVPVFRTLGMSCRWTPRMVPQADRARLVRHLTDPARAAAGDGDMAQVQWIKPLGLFIAHEGKNRVAFLAGEDVELMPARVSTYDYPAPKRLALYTVDEGQEQKVLCVLDDTLVMPVECPGWTVPLLNAYGVELQPWPTTFPSARLVCEELRHRMPDYVGRFAPVDLTLFREVVETQGFGTRGVALMEHDGIQICVLPWLPWVAAALLGLLVVAIFLPADWQMSVKDCVFALGAVVLLVGLACLRILVRLSQKWHSALVSSERSLRHTRRL